jgi:hypothetical protein
MSDNLDKKDKILIHPNPNSPKQGEIILDPDDASEFLEFFSRMNPGDEFKGTYKATMDEFGQKIIRASIMEITIDTEEGENSPKGDDIDEEDKKGNGVTSAAVEMMKNEEGVPDNPNNLPQDTMPTH